MSAGLTEQGKEHGEPAAFSWDGREWLIGPVDFDVEMKFSALLQQRSEEGLRRGAANMGPRVYEDAMRIHLDDVACSEFDWHGRVGTAARFSVNGSADLLFLAITKNHKDFTREHLRRLMREPAPAPETPSKFMEAVGIVRQLTEPPPNG